jgi:transcriptional regulator with XRE-family HTH domain
MWRDGSVPSMSSQVLGDQIPDAGSLADTSPVPRNFRSELGRAGVTNVEAARALGVSERQITRWRGGQVPRHEFVVRMARYFRRPVVWFYTDHEDDHEERGA